MAQTCCLDSLAYVDSTGMVYDPTSGLYIMITNYVGHPLSDAYNKCLSHQTTNVYDPPGGPQDPVDCLCCSPGFTYISEIGGCVELGKPRNIISPIPCITCNCVQAVPSTCDPCGTSGEGVFFTYDFNSKTCESCNPIEPNPLKGKINCFIPVQFSDPFINFKLKP